MERSSPNASSLISGGCVWIGMKMKTTIHLMHGGYLNWNASLRNNFVRIFIRRYFICEKTHERNSFQQLEQSKASRMMKIQSNLVLCMQRNIYNTLSKKKYSKLDSSFMLLFTFFFIQRFYTFFCRGKN